MSRNNIVLIIRNGLFDRVFLQLLRGPKIIWKNVFLKKNVRKI